MTVVHLDEKDLVKKLKDSDDSAFQELVDAYGSRLLRLCYVTVGDKNAAEDLVQEVFVRVYRKIRKFNNDSSLYTWIYRIAVNICRNYLKRTNMHISAPEDESLQSDSDVEIEAITNIDRGRIRDIVFSMPDLYRETVVLFYYEDLSVRQISAILDEPEGTIKNRLFRARIMLKDNLLKEGLYYEEG